MQGSTEYIVAARPLAAFEALAAVVRDRALPVMRANERHLTIVFRPDGDEPLTVMCAVLDAGHGLSKLVATGVDGEDGRIVSVDGYAPRLFADVERRLREKAVDRSGSFARP